jgi:hypothetical protein
VSRRRCRCCCCCCCGGGHVRCTAAAGLAPGHRGRVCGSGCSAGLAPLLAASVCLLPTS